MSEKSQNLQTQRRGGAERGPAPTGKRPVFGYSAVFFPRAAPVCVSEALSGIRVNRRNPNVDVRGREEERERASRGRNHTTLCQSLHRHTDATAVGVKTFLM